MSARPRGLIIAAPSSGAGKTTVVLGLLRALARRGTAVQPFKCGPDYIDTAFHTAAAGRASVNLDTWAMRPQLIAQLLRDAGADADICIVEGVMGLYDSAGTRGACGDGSTADLAALTGWPVVLVLDVGAQAETAAAVALGLKTYRRDIDVAGVILNMTASPGHAGLIAGPMLRIGLPVLGAVQRHADIVMPERHLGLIQAGESTTLDQRLDTIAATVANGVDLDRLVATARPLVLAPGGEAASLPPPGQRIALAQDRAFSFVYAHILAGWRRAGAEIVPFSPLADEAPPAGCDAVWLPGGYPELHAGTLAAASRFRAGMNGAAARGIPIHGECGGYMVLGEGLVDASGARHAMLGLLGVETSFAAPRMHLGYRRARLRNSGAELVGHEFHFASLLANTDEPLADIRDAAGAPVPERGSRRGSVTGTFFHVIDTAAA
ncbi:MAG: cobyrinate a,c-diamide synthase [Hyphomicrobium sp.]|nr:cobyrinate a,c-diamide synthase [Hyphomicrobium sp.]